MAKTATKKTASKKVVTKKTAAKKVKAKASVSKSAKVGEDQIRQRAYEIYQGRNGQAGDPNQDWAQAKKELKIK